MVPAQEAPAMTFPPDRSHAYCTTHSCYVPLNQTEGQCREQHSCSDDACPLEKELGHSRFANAIEQMAASIGQATVKPK